MYTMGGALILGAAAASASVDWNRDPNWLEVRMEVLDRNINGAEVLLVAYSPFLDATPDRYREDTRRSVDAMMMLAVFYVL
mmetsp:Transcript_2924/g.4482  ORF Transcript_2924/g.4482 Transcript_2924/m.4482 type:complete len:81 (-) Transcript_2924:84-326(-)